jgi:CheY-like chemotaxis protein
LSPDPEMGPSSSLPSRRDGKRASLVIVEDNPTDVFLIREALRAYRLEVDVRVFEDGEEAIDLIRLLDSDDSQTCPELMLLDLNLPRADGFEVLKRLRDSRRCAEIPVIVMTSSAALPDRERSKALGADAYFRKQAGYHASLEIGGLIEKLLR